MDSNDELGELAESFNRMTSSLQESEEIRRRMIGDIAHELRTPLTVLSGEVEAIREGVYEPTDEKLEEIQEDINLLNRLIEDLRELTLAEAGELELNREPVDLAELIRKSTNKLSDLAAESDVELKTDLPEAMPEIELDADRILQVINNLVKNAISHTESEEVRISLEEQPEDIVVKIADTGEGIPEDKLEHVFDRFYRVDSSRSGEGGSGLGLSIAKELVRAHGRFGVPHSPEPASIFSSNLSTSFLRWSIYSSTGRRSSSFPLSLVLTFCRNESTIHLRIRVVYGMS